MIIVTSVKDHIKHKKILLKLINDFKEENKVRTESENCSSDYFVEQEVFIEGYPENKLRRKYQEYFYKNMVNSILKSIGDTLALFPKYECIIQHSWFQQYNESDSFAWHNHGETQFANTYFLELPDSAYKTEIIGSDGEIVEYDAKEGDVVTFPAWLVHRSKPNGKGRKTTIAFNSSYLAGGDTRYNFNGK